MLKQAVIEHPMMLRHITRILRAHILRVLILIVSILSLPAIMRSVVAEAYLASRALSDYLSWFGCGSRSRGHFDVICEMSLSATL